MKTTKENSSVFPLLSQLEHLSSMFTESFYVLDIQQKQFCYVKPDDLFLCGFSVDDALGMGYDFYSQIIHPQDLPLWTDLYQAVLRYIKDLKETQDEIDYFSCTFRLQRHYKLDLPHPLPQMIHHRMKCVWEDGKVRYLFCTAAISTCEVAGNLRMYNKDRLTYKAYDISSGHWKQEAKVLLSEREKATLMLAQQGKSVWKIADLLCKGYETIRRQIKLLSLKLNVHSMQEAIDVARCQQLY